MAFWFLNSYLIYLILFSFSTVFIFSICKRKDKGGSVKKEYKCKINKIENKFYI